MKSKIEMKSKIANPAIKKPAAHSRLVNQN
jgi:hypothetical protein